MMVVIGLKGLLIEMEEARREVDLDQEVEIRHHAWAKTISPRQQTNKRMKIGLRRDTIIGHTKAIKSNLRSPSKPLNRLNESHQLKHLQVTTQS
jgi:hypothetical protein